jgi:uncharacterized protein (TIGR02271 family)
MANTVVGTYDNYSEAERAYNELLSNGFSADEVQISSQDRLGGMDSLPATTATEDTSFGSRIGHFFRNLFGSDDESSEQAGLYSEALRRGHALVTVDVDDDEESQRASEILARFNSIDIDERAKQWRSSGWTGFDKQAAPMTEAEIQQDRKAIPVIQEELQVGKREVQRGGVRVYQRVKETPVEESVQLREERVNVERRPVDQPATEADMAALKEGSFEVRATAEEPVVGKTAKVVEEVRVGKEAAERTEKIKDTVRRTDVEVEQLGAAESNRFSDDSEFRKHWQNTYGTSGGRYEDYDEAYRYGYSTMADDRYRNYRWEQAEPELRSDWESHHPGSAWERVKDAVRYGAERVTGTPRR